MGAAVAEWFEEDFDYYPVRKFPEARPAHGREEFAHWTRVFYEGFPRSHWEIRALLPVGGALRALGLEGETLESEQDARADH